MTENTPPDREADDRGLTSEELQDLVFACNYGAIEPGRGTVDCWASHPEVVIELHNVMTEFTRVYQMHHPPARRRHDPLRPLAPRHAPPLRRGHGKLRPRRMCHDQAPLPPTATRPMSTPTVRPRRRDYIHGLPGASPAADPRHRPRHRSSRWHRRRGEKPCPACLAAGNAARAWRARLTAAAAAG